MSAAGDVITPHFPPLQTMTNYVPKNRFYITEKALYLSAKGSSPRVTFDEALAPSGKAVGIDVGSRGSDGKRSLYIAERQSDSRCSW